MDRSGHPKRRILSLVMAVILCIGTILPASPLYAEAEQTSAVDGASAKDDVSEAAPEAENEPAQETPAPEQSAPEKIGDFSAELFYGAEKQDDGTYLWTVPETTDEYKAGHRFNFRLNYKLTGKDTPANAISITVPRHILKEATGMNADTMEWSIPSESEVKSATVDGKVDESRISDNVNFAYRNDDGNSNNYEIYNFRAITGSSDGYIELSYLTSWSSFAYKDREAMNPFQATMSYRENGNVVATRKSDPISIAIDTSAKLTSVTQRAPYSRTTTWDNDWGDASKFGISNTGAYYYLIWDIRSVVNATQSYDFSIDEDSPTSNPDGIKVLGYRFAGENQYTPAGTRGSNVRRNSSLRGERWDHVLTAIPVSEVRNASSWIAHNVVTVTVTPKDGKDLSTTMKSSADWSWSQPTFTEPGGIFNSYKRGDGAARTGNLFGSTTHRASNRGFRAGDYTRYDLEEFNGYNPGTGKSDSDPNRGSYGGFDFASWAVGFPNSNTADGDASEPENYWKKKIRYTLTDEDVFLLNSDDALISQNGSTNRTIENGSIDKNKAIKLQNGDFRIDSLGYSWYMKDAQLNPETQTFQEIDPVYRDGEALKFEGKFNDSDAWITFATYNLKTSMWNKNDTYVASTNDGYIDIKDGQDLTAYRVTTENTHYYTEIFTVPSYSLKNSERVKSLLKDHDKMILLNNNNVVVDKQVDAKQDGNSENQEGSGWDQIFQSEHSDADYACVSQKSSSLTKNVVSSSNNIRQRSYTITWRITEEEKVRTGNTTTGTESYLP